MIYLDNAATSGVKPLAVRQAVQRALENYSVNPGRSGYHSAIKASEAIYATRLAVAEFFGAARPEHVIFTAGCTQSVNMVLKGVLQPGDHLLISDMEHNAVARPAFWLRDYAGVSVDLFDAAANDMEAELARKIKPNTKLIFCLHASNVTGLVLPIETIARVAHRYGILFGVDAAQSAGVLPISMKKTGIDYLCVAAHKGLLAPMGTGLLIAEGPIKPSLLQGGTGTLSVELAQPNTLPEGLESGTVNLPGIMGLSAGLRFVKQKGSDTLLLHERALCQRLKNGLQSLPGVRVYGGLLDGAPVLSFTEENCPSEETAAFLAKKGIAVRAGLHCAPLAHRKIGTADTGTVRLSPGCFTTLPQINTVVSVMQARRTTHRSK